MKEPFKFSVIIPVYNVERYLRQCINSVLDQTYRNMEIILVNDGSLDDCPAICDEYARHDKRAIVIHKKNGGSSSARNSGIEVATGDYILFLDSDDYWANQHCLRSIADSLERSPVDVLCYRWIKLFEVTGKITDSHPVVNVEEGALLKKSDWFKYLAEQSRYWASACDKVIRRKLFCDYDLHFRIGKTAEDVDWAARLAIYADTFGVSNTQIYVYRQRADSISHSLKCQNLVDLKAGVDLSLAYADTLLKDNEFEGSYYAYVAYEYATLLYCCGLVEDKGAKDFYKHLKTYVWLLEYSQHKKIRVMRMVYKLAGYKMLCFMLRLFAQLRKPNT